MTGSGVVSAVWSCALPAHSADAGNAARLNAAATSAANSFVMRAPFVLMHVRKNKATVHVAALSKRCMINRFDQSAGLRALFPANVLVSVDHRANEILFLPEAVEKDDSYMKQNKDKDQVRTKLVVILGGLAGRRTDIARKRTHIHEVL